MPRLAPLARLLLAAPAWAAPSFDRWAHEQHAARLARVAVVGSGGLPGYEQTWREWGTASGERFLAARPSARPTTELGFSLWPRPSASELRTRSADRIRERRAECRAKHHNGNGFGLTLGNALSIHWATTEQDGDMNPDLYRWLMGYPPEWSNCAVTAMQLSRSLARSSSARSSKQRADAA